MSTIFIETHFIFLRFYINLLNRECIWLSSFDNSEPFRRKQWYYS